MERIQRILLALEPIARQLDHLCLPVPLPYEHVPPRQQRSRIRAHIPEDDPTKLLHPARLKMHLFLETAADRLRGLIYAVSSLVEQPAVVGAPNALRLRNAVGEVNFTMRTRRLNKTELACTLRNNTRFSPRSRTSLVGFSSFI